jgi:hypothetical protein
LFYVWKVTNTRAVADLHLTPESGGQPCSTLVLWAL